MIKWMFIRGVYFICKIFPDIGKIIIELASSMEEFVISLVIIVVVLLLRLG